MPSLARKLLIHLCVERVSQGVFAHLRVRSVSPDGYDWHQKGQVTPVICFPITLLSANHVFSFSRILNVIA